MSLRTRSLWIALALPLAAAVGACSEDLQTGETCPLLCPGQGIEIRDTIIDDIVVLDSNLTGFPFQGSEDPLLLAKRGDSLDVRVVVRFDSLQREYARTGTDVFEPITGLDSAYVDVFLRASEVPTPTEWSIDIYNVWDSTLVDTVPASVLPLFEPARRIGTYRGDTAFSDTLRVRIPIDTAYLRALLNTPDKRLRVGMQVRSSASVQLLLNPSEVGNGPTISYKIISSDTTVPPVRNRLPSSLTPISPRVLAGDLVDYQVIAAAPDQRRSGTFTVGGLPATRAYLRMQLPLWLTDSVGLLRAELLLTQDPVSGPSANDSLRLDLHVVLANEAVPSLFRAATLLSAANVFAPSQGTLPSEAGTLRLNVNALVRQWGSANTARALPTAILLRSGSEGGTPGALRFHSTEALDPSVRPRLRVTYTPGTILGRP